MVSRHDLSRMWEAELAWYLFHSSIQLELQLTSDFPMVNHPAFCLALRLICVDAKPDKRVCTVSQCKLRCFLPSGPFINCPCIFKRIISRAHVPSDSVHAHVSPMEIPKVSSVLVIDFDFPKGRLFGRSN